MAPRHGIQGILKPAAYWSLITRMRVQFSGQPRRPSTSCSAPARLGIVEDLDTRGELGQLGGVPTYGREPECARRPTEGGLTADPGIQLASRPANPRANARPDLSDRGPTTSPSPRRRSESSHRARSCPRIARGSVRWPASALARHAPACPHSRPRARRQRKPGPRRPST